MGSPDLGLTPLTADTMRSAFIVLISAQIIRCQLNVGGWGGLLPVLSSRGGAPVVQPYPGIIQIPQPQNRVRLGIDFPLPGAGVGNVKQLAPSNVISDPSDYDDVRETEEVVEAVDNEAEENIGDSNKIELEQPEPCCDHLVSNTVELVNEVSEEIIKEDISENVKCMKKIMMVESLEYDTEVKCDHSYEEMCYTSLVTVYNSHVEQECQEDYVKDCYINYDKAATENTVRVCTKKMVKECPGDSGDDIICSIHHQSECWTKQHEHKVTEDVPECKTVEEKKCNDDVQGTCQTFERQVCDIKTQTVSHYSPVTECEKVPVELCAPAGCSFRESDEEECVDKTVTLIHDEPEETCDIQPKTVCKNVTKLVPSLNEVQNCSDVPQEVCTKVRGKPRKVKRPSVKKWCYNSLPSTTPQPGYGRALFKS